MNAAHSRLKSPTLQMYCHTAPVCGPLLHTSAPGAPLSPAHPTISARWRPAALGGGPQGVCRRSQSHLKGALARFLKLGATMELASVPPPAAARGAWPSFWACKASESSRAASCLLPRAMTARTGSEQVYDVGKLCNSVTTSLGSQATGVSVLTQNVRRQGGAPPTPAGGSGKWNCGAENALDAG